MSSSNRYTSLDRESSAAASPGPAQPSQPQRPPKKRKGHRAGKNKRSRRKSFAILHDHDELGEPSGNGFYKVAQASLSGTSIDSEALLDHR